jgi:hypothetical protein
MSMAIQGLGMSPNLFKNIKFEATRGYLYSAIKSGMAPVLILKRLQRDDYHAVTAVGIKALSDAEKAAIADTINDASGEMVALYIHDDRIGPYVRADIEEKSGITCLQINRKKEGAESTTPSLSKNHESPEMLPNSIVESVNLTEVNPADLADNAESPSLPEGNSVPAITAEGSSVDRWQLTHILVPMHSKIRLSFGELRIMAELIVAKLKGHQDAAIEELGGRQRNRLLATSSLTYSTWIEKSHSYIEQLFIGADGLNAEQVQDLTTSLPLARYVGLIQIRTSHSGNFDVLLDTTSTVRNIAFMGVIVRGRQTNLTEFAAALRSEDCQCPCFM